MTPHNVLAELSAQVNAGQAAGAERAEVMRRLHQAGWTQDQIAAAAGISQAAVSKALRSGTGTGTAPSVLRLRGQVLGIALHLSSHHRAQCGNLALKLAYGGAPVTAVSLGKLLALLRCDLQAPGIPGKYGEALEGVLAALEAADNDAPPATTPGELLEMAYGQHTQSRALGRD